MKNITLEELNNAYELYEKLSDRIEQIIKFKNKVYNKYSDMYHNSIYYPDYFDSICFYNDSVVIHYCYCGESETFDISFEELINDDWHEDFENRIKQIAESRRQKKIQKQEEKEKEERELYLKLKEKYGDA